MKLLTFMLIGLLFIGCVNSLSLRKDSHETVDHNSGLSHNMLIFVKTLKG
jgi:hypothetical protein